jgi:hypothetical protein
VAYRVNPLDSKASSFTFVGVATAHFFARRSEECIDWGRRAAEISPQLNLAPKIMAAALGLLGRLDEARVETAKVLGLDPTASVQRARLSSLRRPWMYDLYLDGLRKAGFPES